MIPVPKPKFFDRKVPAGMSEDDYFNEIYFRQTHVLRDAIDRVSIIHALCFIKHFIACLSICSGPSWYFDVEICKNSF